MNKKSKAVKSNEGVIHLLVTCVEGCGTIFEDYKKADEAHKAAKKHLAETSHEVHIETNILTIYKPQEQTL